ncbi:hypothetical protein AcV5_003077 [Taiwanofungus camphoratus]|nr:hypothetical protein AcV5_003077 [Antrodia cinnamomea]
MPATGHGCDVLISRTALSIVTAARPLDRSFAVSSSIPSQGTMYLVMAYIAIDDDFDLLKKTKANLYAYTEVAQLLPVVRNEFCLTADACKS